MAQLLALALAQNKDLSLSPSTFQFVGGGRLAVGVFRLVGCVPAPAPRLALPRD